MHFMHAGWVGVRRGAWIGVRVGGCGRLSRPRLISDHRLVRLCCRFSFLRAGRGGLRIIMVLSAAALRRRRRTTLGTGRRDAYPTLAFRLLFDITRQQRRERRERLLLNELELV